MGVRKCRHYGRNADIFTCHYRLSRSPHSKQFVLKGGLLLLVWLGETIRPTRDVDLLGFGDLGADALTVTPAFVEVEGKRAQCAVGRLSASQSAQGPYQPQSRDRRACRFRRPGAHGGWARRAIHGNLAARWAMGGDVVTLTKNEERHAGQRRFRPYPEYAARSVVSRNCRAPNNCMELRSATQLHAGGLDSHARVHSYASCRSRSATYRPLANAANWPG